jgi:hypothetical protein
MKLQVTIVADWEAGTVFMTKHVHSCANSLIVILYSLLYL